MRQVFDERFPWITYDPESRIVRDERSGETQTVETHAQIWGFIADHSAQTPGQGLGDWVHRALDWAGFQRCLPCAKRQAYLNAFGAKSSQ